MCSMTAAYDIAVYDFTRYRLTVSFKLLHLKNSDVVSCLLAKNCTCYCSKMQQSFRIVPLGRHALPPKYIVFFGYRM